MKILKLLNKKYLSIFFIYVFLFSLNLKAEEEPVDIWDLDKEAEQNSSIAINENDDSVEIKIDTVNTDVNNSINKINSNALGESKISIVGLYDPEDNGLNIDMWSKSNGDEIKLILSKLDKMNLSKDSKEILDIVLLTNSYFPEQNITEQDLVIQANTLIGNSFKLQTKADVKIGLNVSSGIDSQLMLHFVNEINQGQKDVGIGGGPEGVLRLNVRRACVGGGAVMTVPDVVAAHATALRAEGQGVAAWRARGVSV